MEAYDSYIYNMEKHFYDNKSIKNFKMVDKWENDTPKTMYYEVKIPFVATRECLVVTNPKKLENGDWFYYANSIERDDYPVKNGNVRMGLFNVSTIT